MKNGEALKPIDSEIAEILFKQHLVFRNFLVKQVGDVTVAEDILQECLVKAVQKGGQLRNSESVVAWFYRILRNAMTDHYRKSAAEERKDTGYLEELIAYQEDRVHAKEQDEAEICRCFSGLLETLRPAYAELLRRIDLGGESAENVARNLGITQSNLNVRLHRARQALKTSLERSCGTCAEHGCLDCQCAGTDSNLPEGENIGEQ